MSDTSGRAEAALTLRRVAHDFEQLGDELSRSTQPTAFEAVTRVAVRRVPAASAASITTVKHGRFTTVGATDDFARHADHLQYELQSGPCVDAIVDDALYQPKDLATDDRWPEYGRRVVDELGFHSMLSYRIHVEVPGVIAGMNLYAFDPVAFDEHDLAQGLLLATYAAQALTAAYLRDRAENLERALATNREIGTSVGVLMALHRLTAEQAFDLLRIASQNSNRKLREVALDVIDTGMVDVTPHSRG
ncbi:hypothetical protein GCM10009740_04030 [Terrabacter terrae]|uniref:ANTAR domain-containing protein n=1 Tax=Terrabacter terrae TaxID=318434 RepID=A0ABP5F737_9MICO